MASRVAILLAGGRGTRLYPYTVALPKPLVPVGDVPIAEIVIRQLAHYGFDRLVLAVNHQADLLAAYFGDGRKWGLSIEYSLEDSPLGTMGPLALIDELPENFLVMNGDILCDLDFGTFLERHSSNEHTFTIAATKRELSVDFGVLDVDQGGNLRELLEKPTIDYTVSMGIYAVSRSVLSRIPRGRPYGFDNLMGDLLNAGEIVNVEPFDGLWLDIGRPADYELANDTIQMDPDRFIRG